MPTIIRYALYLVFGIAFGALVGTALNAQAAFPTFTVPQGGTGSTTLSGILKGNAANPVQTAVPGTDYLTPTNFYTLFAATNTDALDEGSTNLYFTNARADARFVAGLAATTSVSSIIALPNLSLPYSQLTGTPDLSAYLTLTAWYATTTDGLDEGATNLYFTNARTRSALSATFPITYNSGTGAFSYSGVATSSAPTIGNLAYWTGAQTLGTVATSAVTINAPLTSAGTAGYVVGGSGWTLDVDDIQPPDLASADFGHFSCNGTTCSLDANTVGAGALDESANFTFNGFLTMNGHSSLATFNATSGSTTNATSTSLYITGRTSAVLATDNNGQVIATTSIGSNYITGALGTLNGTSLSRGGSITITAASSTLLSDNNTWQGTNLTLGPYHVENQFAYGDGHGIEFDDAGYTGSRFQLFSDATNTITFYADGNGFSWIPSFSGLTADRNIIIPDTSGTLAVATSSLMSGFFVATSTTASQLRYASTTALTVSGTAYFPGSGIWNSSGNVGIGTTTPTTRLAVGSNGSGVLSLPYGAGTGITIPFSAGTPFTRTTLLNVAFANGRDTLTIGVPGATGNPYYSFPDGNVGIGTTTPSEKLEIGDSTNAVIAGVITNSNAGAAAAAELNIRNGYTAARADALRIITHGTNLTTSGAFIQDGALIDAETGLSGGLTLMARASGGAINFYTGGFSSGFQRMIINSSGNVGIGTTSPSSEFELGDLENGGIIARITNTSSGTGAFSELNLRNDYTVGAGLRILTTGTGFTASGPFLQDAGAVIASSILSGGLTIGTQAAAPIAFFTSNAEKVRIDSSGNVGIGTTSPSNVLDLDSSSTAGTRLGIANSSTGGRMWNFFSSGSAASIGAGRFVIADGSNGNLARLTIDSSGRVGIGTTSPATTLSVAGNTTITSATQFSGFFVSNGNNTIADIKGFGSGNDNGTLQLYNSGSVAVKIIASGVSYLNGGNVGIGTTSPNYKLSVQNSSEGNTLQLYDTDGNCLIDPDAAGLTTTCTSDSKFKTNVQDTAVDGLKYLMGFRIRDYTMLSSGRTMTGVIAQEVQQTHPELVQNIVSTSTYEVVVGTDAEGNPIYETKEATSSALFVTLPSIWQITKAIQQLVSVLQGIFHTVQGAPTHIDGMTIYSRDTNEAYCVFIQAGNLTKTKGVCQ